MPIDHAAASRAIAAHLDEWLGETAVVLTYLAMAGELDPGPPPRGRTLLVTRTPSSDRLTVHRADADREVHPLGFEQPVEGSPEWTEPIDVVLVPGRAFGPDGRRLGRGGGHYDRLLSARPVDVRVGVTVDALVVEGLPVEPHDVAITHLVTESGVRPVDA